MPVDIVLLGEAPTDDRGLAFPFDAFTTEQVSGAIGVKPFDLKYQFWLDNVFDLPQRDLGNGYDDFPHSQAVSILQNKHFKSMRIVCVGNRVARALEEALGIMKGQIPENDFALCFPNLRRGKWFLARIPHPSACRNNPPDSKGNVIPREAQHFLRQLTGH